MKQLKRLTKSDFVFNPFHFVFRRRSAVNFHRKLFLYGWRVWPHCLLLPFSMVYWYGFCLWKNAFRAVFVISNERLQRYANTRRKLFFELMKYGLFYALSPRQYFRFKLHNVEQKKLIYHYVYDHQASIFHRYINRYFSNFQKQAALLADKYLFEQHLKKLSIPTIASKKFATSDLKHDMSPFFQTKIWKPKHGSQSRDVFLSNFDASSKQHIIEIISGKRIDDPQQVSIYLNMILNRYDELLMQDLVEDHQAIKAISQHPASTTMRIITARMAFDADPILLYLQLEMPAQKRRIGRTLKQFYHIVPLDLQTLDPDVLFMETQEDLKEKNIIMSDHMKNIISNAIDYCLTAHQSLNGLRSIAFDVILSPAGPVILEANVSWAPSLLFQVLYGDPLSPDQQHPAAQWLRGIFNEI